MRYMQVKFIIAVFILIVGIVFTSLPRVTAQRQPVSAEERVWANAKLLLGELGQQL